MRGPGDDPFRSKHAAVIQICLVVQCVVYDSKGRCNWYLANLKAYSESSETAFSRDIHYFQSCKMSADGNQNILLTGQQTVRV